jgi:hypothetical protein
MIAPGGLLDLYFRGRIFIKKIFVPFYKDTTLKLNPEGFPGSETEYQGRDIPFAGKTTA